MPSLRSIQTQSVTLQARLAQLAMQDLLAPTVQQVGTLQVCTTLLCITNSSY